ncbi:SAM-dependent methyltransferase [Paenibacillus yonginensis]|uniref:SAM-dependent methyltransferase n=1 Tax=Paenibacillus yonginensis TaxID=1462996 RepID=A0A1B1MYJ6_9BACL|nr:class I SAM-dependent methyltransferase [Paenibacillus yonginensis]ANS74258.1 SAM-dependent methyltransferase [Paenibacillus yonginensis]
MPEQTNPNNINRFNGFGNLYDQNRPSAPTEVVRLVEGYLNSKPELVVDVGCGTGLSSFLWLGEARKVIGVEPNDDMRSVAVGKWRQLQEPEGLAFVKGLSHQLELPSASADVITCSQSFHWMEPVSTLREFARVLKPGGVFAAYDCDWPPAFRWEIEEQYMNLLELGDQRARELAEQDKWAVKRDKNQHLQQIRTSGWFRYTREIVFHQRETFNAERYVNLALSQGGIQTALKLGAADILEAAEEFRHKTEASFDGQTLELLISYRMRLGIK